jgi:hypothetical protein
VRKRRVFRYPENNSGVRLLCLIDELVEVFDQAAKDEFGSRVGIQLVQFQNIRRY